MGDTPQPIALNDVTFSYRRGVVLDNVTWSVQRGLTALMGPNGAGKTTLLRLMAGELTPHSGRVSRPDGAVALLPQEFDLIGSMRVESTVSHAAWCAGRQVAELAAVVAEALRRVSLEDRRRDRVRSLSGGMRQRLGVACVLAARPDVLLLDEPSVGLDPVQRRSLRSLLSELATTMPVVVSTHLVDDVASTADHVTVLDAGRIVFAGGLDELLKDGTDLESAYVDLVTSR